MLFIKIFVFTPSFIVNIGCCSLLLTIIMPELETCIRFGKHGACVMIEDEEIQHYDIQVDMEKKEATCWIASEAGKVSESLFTMTSCSFQI
jgi:hypothetical protein